VRLISARTAAGETLGVVLGDGWRAASELLDGGPRTMADLITAGRDTLDDLTAAAASATTLSSSSSAPRLPRLADADLLAPLPRPGKVVAIGRNYKEHADEEGVDPPTAPLVFAKWPSSVVGPGADIRWDPELTAQVDYEAELAVVIGRTARNVSQADALDYVLGYTCLNDVSARDLQFGDGQWVRGKSLDTFCPMGPILVTADEIGDPQALAISCRVNGELLQNANTSRMYFGVAEIISFVSRSFTLEPGDVIATGTPSGVGVFRDPPRFLADGDVVTVEIEGIGRLVNTCRFEPAGVRAPAASEARA
jgi:2-keto-4-pentenoate hydratase/2-oxohepta-3-ene-1,7-dioic acid hydratase in catechol pathway